MNGLTKAGISDRHIHLIANEQTQLDDLPEPGTEATDFVPALQRGAALGGTTGLLAGITAVAFPPAGITLGGGALLASGVVGATVGAWAALIIGISAPNSQLHEFKEAIKNGQILILVETEQNSVEEIQSVIKRHYVEADIKDSQHVTAPLIG